MTTSPATLRALAAYWVSKGGTNLGIVGDAAHKARPSYHNGQDVINANGWTSRTDYSIRHARDREPHLTNAAAAIDLGRLKGSLDELYAFSTWLVAQCQRSAPGGTGGTGDIREVIYSPDGDRVQRYSGVDGGIHTGPGNGDSSHLFHTHISYFRDSEKRDKVAVFRPYFDDTTGEPDVPARTFRWDKNARLGTATVEIEGLPADHKYVRLADAKLYPISDGTPKRALGLVTLCDQQGKPVGPGGPSDPRSRGYIIEEEAAFLIEEDVTFVPDPTDETHRVTLRVDDNVVAEVTV